MADLSVDLLMAFEKIEEIYALDYIGNHYEMLYQRQPEYIMGHDYQQKIEYMANQLVFPEERNLFLWTNSPMGIQQLLNDPENVFYYRQKIGQQYCWCLLTCLPSQDKQKEVIVKIVNIQHRMETFKGSFVDKEVEKNKQLEQLLQESWGKGEILNQFLHDVSFDLRTPINTIMGMTAVATTEVNNPEKVAGCLMKINAASQQLKRLIEDMLAMVQQSRSQFVQQLEQRREQQTKLPVMEMIDWSEEYAYSGYRFLVVEDNVLNLEIVTELMAKTGALLETAGDGEAALNKVREKPKGYYDLVLMDIQMPKMNGYEATIAIRQLPWADASQLPIVAMTANAFVEDINAALMAGMNAHVAKPFSLEELLGTMDNLLAKKR